MTIQESKSLSQSHTVPSQELLDRMSEFFKSIAYPSRMKIISILAQGELCVSELTQLVGMNQSAVSHQLKILKEQEIVSSRKKGKEVFYSICDRHVMMVYQQAYSHLTDGIEYYI